MKKMIQCLAWVSAAFFAISCSDDSEKTIVRKVRFSNAVTQETQYQSLTEILKNNCFQVTENTSEENSVKNLMLEVKQGACDTTGVSSGLLVKTFRLNRSETDQSQYSIVDTQTEVSVGSLSIESDTSSDSEQVITYRVDSLISWDRFSYSTNDQQQLTSLEILVADKPSDTETSEPSPAPVTSEEGAPVPSETPAEEGAPQAGEDNSNEEKPSENASTDEIKLEFPGVILEGIQNTFISA